MYETNMHERVSTNNNINEYHGTEHYLQHRCTSNTWYSYNTYEQQQYQVYYILSYEYFTHEHPRYFSLD